MLPSEIPRLATDAPVRVFPGLWKLLFKDSLSGGIFIPTSFVSLFIFYILSYLLSKKMGCLSGCLMSSASIQKLFCGIYSAFKCSYHEFVREKVVSASYSSAILGLPPWSLTMFLRFTHIVMYISNSFFFIAEYYSVVWIYHGLFIHSPIDGHYGVMTAKNMLVFVCVCMCVWTCFHFSRVNTCEWNCWVKGRYVLKFIRNCHIVFQCGCPILSIYL